MSELDEIYVNFESPLVFAENAAIGVVNGVIQFVETHPQGISARKVVDCQGKTLLPGIDDSHLHAYEFGRTFINLDVSLSRCPNLDAIRAVLEDAEPQSNGWIIGSGWDGSHIVGTGSAGAVTAADLDEARADVPIFLSDITGHQGWCNSLALEIAGLKKFNVPDPAGGKLARDEDGQPTGLIFEAAVKLINAVIPDISRRERCDAIIAAQKSLLAQGIVSVTDPGLGPGAVSLMDGTGTFDAIHAYRDLDSTRELLLRVNIMVLFGGLGGTSAKDVLEGLDAWGQPMRMPTYGHLGIDQLKIFADGIPRSRTAWMSDPYDDCTHGALQLAGDTDVEKIHQLKTMVAGAAAKGWQIGLHTIGDRAINEVIHSIEEIEDPRHRNLRHYIIHGDFASDEDLIRMSNLGMSLNANPSIRWFVGDSVVPVIGRERNSLRQRLRSAWDYGVNVCASSDAPVSPPDWKVMVAAMITRSIKSDPQRTDNQKLSVIEALKSVTENAAWQSHSENWRGSLAPGQAADFVLMDSRINWDDPWSLPDAHVQQTVVGGIVAYSA